MVLVFEGLFVKEFKGARTSHGNALKGFKKGFKDSFNPDVNIRWVNPANRLFNVENVIDYVLHKVWTPNPKFRLVVIVELIHKKWNIRYNSPKDNT